MSTLKIKLNLFIFSLIFTSGPQQCFALRTRKSEAQNLSSTLTKTSPEEDKISEQNQRKSAILKGVACAAIVLICAFLTKKTYCYKPTGGSSETALANVEPTLSPEQILELKPYKDAFANATANLPPEFVTNYKPDPALRFGKLEYTPRSSGARTLGRSVPLLTVDQSNALGYRHLSQGQHLFETGDFLVIKGNKYVWDSVTQQFAKGVPTKLLDQLLTANIIQRDIDSVLIRNGESVESRSTTVNGTVTEHKWVNFPDGSIEDLIRITFREGEDD